MSETLLQVNQLHTYFSTPFGDAKAVDNITFHINKGESYCLVGESGCGKSITALSIIQLVPKPAGYHPQGEVVLQGKNLLSLPESQKRRIRGNKIAMIFQEPMTSLNPVLTVGNQIMEVLFQHRDIQKKEARSIALDLLNEVRIPDPEARLKEYPHQLSGGMKQRVMIAIALACEPELLIADEPTTALDVTIQAQILKLLRELQIRHGMALLMITHDLGVVKQVADRVGVMYAGKIIEEASKNELFHNPIHPYTIKLFDSLPSAKKRGRKLASIRGMVPAATRFPDWCRFYDRCDLAQNNCKQSEPPLINLRDDGSGISKQASSDHQSHWVACFYHKQTDTLKVQSKVEEGLKKGQKAKTILEVNDLKTHFPIKKGIFKRVVGHVRAVDGISLDIPKNNTLALVGESGCGKTTVGKTLVRLVDRTEGSIHFDEKPIHQLSNRLFRDYRRSIQMIFQDPYSSLDPRMMVKDIIKEGMNSLLEQPPLGNASKYPIGNWFQSIMNNKQNEAEQTKIIAATLERVGLSAESMNKYPHEFSGGQRQRIGIARVLVLQPDFIICDEATSALDVSIQAQILNLLKDLQYDFDLTYLFITHNLSVVQYLADQVAVMYLGRIVERGTVDDIFAKAKHPYTQALLTAIPEVDEQTGRSVMYVEGDVPSPINPPMGCHFHPRCPSAMEICNQKYPDTTTFSETHQCRCYLYHKDSTTSRNVDDKSE